MAKRRVAQREASEERASPDAEGEEGGHYAPAPIAVDAFRRTRKLQLDIDDESSIRRLMLRIRKRFDDESLRRTDAFIGRIAHAQLGIGNR
jgi:hypothetical protein